MYFLAFNRATQLSYKAQNGKWLVKFWYVWFNVSLVCFSGPISSFLFWMAPISSFAWYFQGASYNILIHDTRTQHILYLASMVLVGLLCWHSSSYNVAPQMVSVFALDVEMSCSLISSSLQAKHGSSSVDWYSSFSCSFWFFLHNGAKKPQNNVLNCILYSKYWLASMLSYLVESYGFTF